MLIFESFHTGRDLAALEFHNAIKGTDFDIAVAHDEDASLLSRNNIESFGAEYCGERPTAIGGGPSRTHHLGNIGQLHALAGERLSLGWRSGRFRLVWIGTVGRFEPVCDIGSAVCLQPSDARRMMASERRGLTHLEFNDAHGGLHADDFEAGWQDIAIKMDATDDQVQMAATLTAPARLVVIDERSLVLLCAEMP
ncbi:hypothetical protein [Rhizobium sp. NFR12]|uniref:hypothetical protein n=1 Tax=Rhizobium sp. NFR12 TaxID=1566261 RepID=UPI0008A7E2BB|nr:hypothetical protein [Rhizobium sp. NFR12]SEH27881.1 hypothetical protein SAMN03159407_3372 [Rhizobium sp. NFR12]